MPTLLTSSLFISVPSQSHSHLLYLLHSLLISDQINFFCSSLFLPPPPPPPRDSHLLYAVQEPTLCKIQSLSMAAEVGSLFHFLSGYKEEEQKIKAEDPNIPITRDLLGGSKELDLDFQVPNGWEKRLDLKSGKVYLQQRCNSLNSSSSSAPKPKQQQISVSQLQDLNFPPNLVEEGFDLQKKEVFIFPSVDYQSVCTLDKVRSALERVERGYVKKRSLSGDSSSSMTISSSLSSLSPLSTRGRGIGDGDGEKSSESTESSPFFTAACPNCLFYVLTSKKNPKCPKCDVVVPFRSLKKPKIDLNS
ncbi:hypothetical protein AAC387_Pa05g3456 [Persea americana]